MLLLTYINILKHYDGNSFGSSTLLTGAGSLLRYLSAYWNVGVGKLDLK